MPSSIEITESSLLSTCLEADNDVVGRAEISTAAHAFVDLALNDVVGLLEGAEIVALPVLVDDLEQPLGGDLLGFPRDKP